MTTMVSMDKDFENAGQNLPKPQKRLNLFDKVMAPQMITLKILGLGQNNFTYRPYRYAYNAYFLLILGFCMAAAYATYFHNIIKAFHSLYMENVLDQFAYFSDEFVWCYELFAVLIFLIWALKWKKVSGIFRLMDEERFQFFHSVADDAYVRSRTLRLTIASYTLHLIFATMALAWPIINFLAVGFYLKIIIYSSSFFPNLIICFCLSFSTLMYLCTAESWNIFLYSLKKEGDRLGSSSEPLDFEDIVEQYSSRYDALTELTAAVADTFRYFATMHVCAFLSIINLLYQTLFDHTFKTVYMVYNWLDILAHLTPLLAATTVYICSSQTVSILHNVYKRYHENDKNQNTPMIHRAAKSQKNYLEPSPAYSYLYQRVAGEKACLNLDIAGLVAVTKTTVAALLFAAINWCAVVVQFRQQAPDCPVAMIMSNGTNITSQH